MAPEPNPCQCGAEPFVDWWSPAPGIEDVFVRCNKCGKIGPVAETEAAAVAAWNRPEQVM